MLLFSLSAFEHQGASSVRGASSCQRLWRGSTVVLALSHHHKNCFLPPIIAIHQLLSLMEYMGNELCLQHSSWSSYHSQNMANHIAQLLCNHSWRFSGEESNLERWPRTTISLWGRCSARGEWENHVGTLPDQRVKSAKDVQEETR